MTRPHRARQRAGFGRGRRLAGWSRQRPSPQLQGSDAGDMYFGLTTAVGSLVVSNLEGPLADVRVRQALLMAMDRKGILDAAAGGIGEVTDVLTTESVWVDADPAAVTTAFDDVDAYPYDLDGGEGARRRGRCRRRGDRHRHRPDLSDFAVISQATAAAARIDRTRRRRSSRSLRAPTRRCSPTRRAREESTSSSPAGISPALTRSRCTRCCARANSATTAAGATPNSTRSSRRHRHRRSCRTQRRDREGPADRERGAAVAAAVHDARCRSSSVTGSPASHRRSRSCTTRGRRRLVRGSAATGAHRRRSV